jgi:acetyl-CoA hydrolase
MNWRELYRDRIQTAEEAVQAIKSRTRVFLTANCSVPKDVLQALVERAPKLTAVEIAQVLTIGPANYVAPEMEGHIRVNTLFISDNVRQAVNEGRADFTPCFLSEIPLLFKSGRLPLDVALIQVSPPDEHGFCSLGVEIGVTKSAAQAAKYIIAEVNPHMPRTLGDSFIHISKLDSIVPVDYALPKFSWPRRTTSQAIADHVHELIPDEATLGPASQS